MAKEVAGLIKLQIKGGAANPSPPVGPALGSKGINIMDFCKQFNARTQEKAGKVLPVVITQPYEDCRDYLGSGEGNCGGQDARPQLLHGTGCYAFGCWYSAQYGYHD